MAYAHKPHTHTKFKKKKCFFERWSLKCPGYLGTHYIHQADLELNRVSASRGLGLATVPSILFSIADQILAHGTCLPVLLLSLVSVWHQSGSCHFHPFCSLCSGKRWMHRDAWVSQDCSAVQMLIHSFRLMSEAVCSISKPMPLKSRKQCEWRPGIGNCDSLLSLHLNKNLTFRKPGHIVRYQCDVKMPGSYS